MKKSFIAFLLAIVVALSFTAVSPAFAMTDAEFLSFLKGMISDSRIPEAVGNDRVAEIEAKIAAEEADTPEDVASDFW